MATGLWNRLHSERRRLLVVVLLAFLAGYLFYLRADLYIHGIHVALITGAIYAGVIAVAAVVVCLAFPAMRFMIEAVAVSRLMLAFFVLAVPETGFRILASPALTAFLVVGGGVAVSRLLHGRFRSEAPRGWRDRIVPRSGRSPARLSGRPWQQRFVAWLDDAAPVPA